MSLVKERRVFRISEVAIQAGAPLTLLGCPFVIGPAGLRSEVNAFLEDKFLGRWRPPRMEATRRRRVRPCSDTVMQSAHRLDNFHRWLEHERLLWEEAGEADIERYAEAMADGEWTSDRQCRPLASSTIGARQVEVIHQMLWEADRGRRSFSPGGAEYEIAVPVPGGSNRKSKRWMYDVVRRADPAAITFPAKEEVQQHIQSIKDPAYAIATKLIYMAGLRGSEPGQLIVEYLPGRRRAGRFGMLTVFGKGKKLRQTELDPCIEEEINDFLAFTWPARMRRRPVASDPLLIGESGLPIRYRGLWEQFSRYGPVSPHIGRHYYAIQYLLRGWEAQQEVAARSGLHLSNDQMPSLLSMDLLNLSRNLGHSDPSTTNRYLAALSQYTRNTDIALTYQGHLDE